MSKQKRLPNNDSHTIYYLMDVKKTTQWSEDWELNDALNSSTNGSLFSSQEVSNNSKGGAESLPGKAGFVIIMRCLVVAFGVIGFVMNGFVLCAVLSKKLKKNTSHTFLKNQIIMDTLSSLLLIVVYAFKLAAVDYYYEGPSGYVVCILLNSDVLVFTVQVGSIASLVLISAERYFKIVLPVLHKRFYRDWMTSVAIAFAWMNGILMNIVIPLTTIVVDGECLIWVSWVTPEACTMYVVLMVIWQFFIPLLLFIWFYGSILFVIRRRNRVTYGGNPNNENNSARRSQMNIVITMFTVSLSFVVSWSPNQLSSLLNIMKVTEYDFIVYSSTMLFVFLNTCLNPLIYASKHELVRKNLRRMFLNKETTNTTQLVESNN